MKIVQLEGYVKDLKVVIAAKEQEIKELVVKVEKSKLEVPNE